MFTPVALQRAVAEQSNPHARGMFVLRAGGVLCFALLTWCRPMPSNHQDNFSTHDLALIRLADTLRVQGYQFVTPTPATHERVNSRAENSWAASLRDVFGWSRPFREQVVPSDIFLLMQEAGILVPVDGGFRSQLRLSSLNDQLLWHAAFPTTATDAVFFGPDTYRFALAIDLYLKHREAPVRRATDIGSGTGAGAMRVALAHPDAQVWAGDINAQALRLSRINASIARTKNVLACQSNLLDGVQGDFDLIVANPPYLNDSLKRSYRHGGGSHGQELAVAMLEASLPRLRPEGTLLLYTGSTVVDGVDTFMSSAEPVLRALPSTWHKSYVEMDPDVFGEELEHPAYQDADRIAAVVLRVTAA